MGYNQGEENGKRRRNDEGGIGPAAADRRSSLAAGEEVWIAGAAFPWAPGVQTVARLLRGHWTVENRVFYVRDVTMEQDRLHGRRIGPALSSLRNVVLSLLRRFFPGHFLPDAQRRVGAMPGDDLSLLTAPLEL